MQIYLSASSIHSSSNCIYTYLQKSLADKVIYAINAGGEAHADTYGIRYQRDPLRSVGTASDYGKQLLIGKNGKE